MTSSTFSVDVAAIRDRARQKMEEHADDIVNLLGA